MVYCATCGQANADTANFCASCGTAIVQPMAPPSLFQPAPPHSQMLPVSPVSQQMAPNSLPQQSLSHSDPQQTMFQLGIDQFKDQWLGFTRQVFADFLENDTYSGVEIPTPFPPQFAEDEKRIAKAPFQCYAHYGLEYTNNASPTAAALFTNANVAAGAAYAAGSLIANNRAKKNAQAQWRFDDQGEIIVTQYGLYFLSTMTAKTTPLNYNLFYSAQMTAWDSIELEYDPRVNEGEINKMAFVTPSAPMIFMFWATEVYPKHPQLKSLLGITD